MRDDYIEKVGSITYLGDWHSHPDNASYLSQQDKLALSNISNYKPARLPEPIMIIIGTYPIEIKGWIYQKNLIRGSSYIKMDIGLWSSESGMHLK